MTTCPVCRVSLRPRAAQCDGCGTLIPIDDAEPPRRRRRSSEDGLPFGGAFRSWGFIAGVIVYVPCVGAAAVFLYLVEKSPNVELAPMFQGVLVFCLGLPLVPAALAWMVVDSVHASWNWVRDPRGRETPWLNWWAGPVRLGLLALPPLLGGTLGLLLAAPAERLPILAAGSGLGAFFGICCAAAVSVVVRALS